MLISSEFTVPSSRTRKHESIDLFGRFPLGRVARAAALGGLALPQGQQSLIVLLAAHQDGTKQGPKCSHDTKSLDDLWAAFPWVKPAGLASSNLREAFWTHGRINVAGSSLFGDVARHSGLYEFHSCSLFRNVPDHELSANSNFCRLHFRQPSQSLPMIHDHR